MYQFECTKCFPVKRIENVRFVFVFHLNYLWKIDRLNRCAVCTVYHHSNSELRVKFLSSTPHGMFYLFSRRTWRGIFVFWLGTGMSTTSSLSSGSIFEIWLWRKIQRPHHHISWSSTSRTLSSNELYRYSLPKRRVMFFRVAQWSCSNQYPSAIISDSSPSIFISYSDNGI